MSSHVFHLRILFSFGSVKVDDEEDASKVVEVEACDLPSLNGLMSEESLQQWKQSWQEAIKQADSILELPFPIFWSSLIYSPKILQFIDAFLDVFPRQWELEEMDLYMNRDPLVRSLAIGLYERVLFILLRAIIGRENKTSLSDGFYSRTIYDHKVFTVERLFDLINVYWSSNNAAVTNILKRTIGVQRKYMNDAGNYVDICVQRMDVVAAELNSLTRHPFEKEGCGDRVASLLSMLIGLFEALQIFHPFCCPEIRHKCFASLPISIASLVERLEGYLTEPVFAQLALCALWSTSRSLLRLYDEFRASALQLFHSLISMDKLNEETIATFQEALAYESFIFYYNMVYPINVTLASTISNEHAHDLSKFFNDTLTEISTKQTHMIIDALKNRGLLVQLGNPIDDTISSVLSEINELLPHFSPQFIHLCLRHFGYDKERTTNALLDTTMLPLDLRALLFADLSLETVPSNTGLQFELPIGMCFRFFFAGIINLSSALYCLCR
ncbi:unnamed protein product [Toxocara canis]|uniref:CUE domain-containing protein n=1 Tax=Toxocara canis TaxID=6265 RepID=A0A183V7K6_TOXCA|nr:unnamed protein product [Toxocara canis]